jgi:DNA invertase Pin-like site-specific DNA recombinase
MSTDRQELSPEVQRQEIAAYAQRHNLELVATYEDLGKSGLTLSGRPSLKLLLHDVAERREFEAVLVYDVSRWGRFQDIDEAAYYEYHCRQNGVAVHYVAESFPDNAAPMTALLKSLKRVMAAEYSRELGQKCRAGQERVVELGFQMGRLPPLGYRRVSVSSSGMRVPIGDGQRKVSATDRIAWVLGPAQERVLVRRIFSLYATGAFTIRTLVKQAHVEGWRDARGEPFTSSKLRRLLHNEAVIGTFVWGRPNSRGRLNPPKGPTLRAPKNVPRIVDDQTWARVQEKLCYPKGLSPQTALDQLREAIRQNPFLAREHLSELGLMDSNTYRRRFGSWAAALRNAGADRAARCAHGSKSLAEHRAYSIAFGKGLAEAMNAAGIPANFDGAFARMLFPGADVYVRLLRAQRRLDDLVWTNLRRGRPGTADHVVLVFADEVPLGAVLLSTDDWGSVPASIKQTSMAALKPFWCASASELVERLRSLWQPSRPCYALLPNGEHRVVLSTSSRRRQLRDAYRAAQAHPFQQ